MADRSLQHHPFELSHTRTRQASISSSDQSSPTEDKSTTLHPRRRRASSSSGLPQPSVAFHPEPSSRRRGSKQPSLGARDKTSRGHLGTMSGSSDLAGEVTYTPTTHRISKAKKGKKVHVCEYVGCGKVFTRAEHRKRHEANHNPEPTFQCSYEDCRKPFHRADLLARHTERQHEVPSGTLRPHSQRSTSEVSSNPPNGGIMATPMGQPQPVNAQAMSHGHGAMAITSIIEHPMRGNELSLPAQTMSDISQTGIGPIPSTFRPEWGRSPVPDLQTVFHLEMFNLFRARSAKLESLQSSTQFRTLYDSFVADQDFLQVKQASFQQALPPPNAPDQLQTVYRRWVEHETRRRMLVAMFVVETQHGHLLQRQPCYSGTLDDSLDLPFPTSAETWDCSDIFTWRSLIASHEAFSISELGRNLPSLDAFRSSLLTCYQVHGFQFSSDPKQHDLNYQPPKSLDQHTLRTHHALALSTHTPLHALLITASESWLFGTKITDNATWQQSKTTLREWTGSENAAKATWHATQLLRHNFQSQSDPLQQDTVTGGYLHDLWSLYVAALVGWAFGYATTNAKAQPETLKDNAEVLAAEYLTAMSVNDWKDIGNVAGTWAGYTRGLLEWVRSEIGDVGMGGLLNGAEDVLFRLVEGESKLVEF
ncbi:MAG: hypothetical protein Q9226_003741 [Calogaya cf. arnoldii]